VRDHRPGPAPTSHRPGPAPTSHRPGPAPIVPRAAARRVEDLVGPDDELIAGRHPVEEAFAARREARRLIVVPQRRAALEGIVLHATRLRIPVVEVEGGTLTALAGFDGHQGVALVVAPRRFASLDDALARARMRGEPPFLLVLDSLEDPQNLGTVLRSAEAAGVHGVVFPTRRQAPLTPAAVKASAGAVEHLLLIPVDDLAGTLADLHVRGVRVVGSEAEAPLTARQADLRGPLALVVGSEGRGLGPAVHRRCDLLVRIPMRGVVGSLNAAVAGSILLYEAVGQRDPEGRRSGSPGRPGDFVEPSPESADEPSPDDALTSAVGPPASDAPRATDASRAGDSATDDEASRAADDATGSDGATGSDDATGSDADLLPDEADG
jgi:23S rRNA (guanosine2251-2'-O)-methyltransferase